VRPSGSRKRCASGTPSSPPIAGWRSGSASIWATSSWKASASTATGSTSRPAGRPGGGRGICISRTVYEQIQDRLAVACDDLGERELKNILKRCASIGSAERSRDGSRSAADHGATCRDDIQAFGAFEVDRRLYQLRRGAEVVKIEPKVFDVLVYLLEHRARVVSKDELLEKLWPGEFVSESVLPRCITAARKAVGDDLPDSE